MSQHNVPDGLFHEVWHLYSSGHTSDEIMNRLMKRELDLEVVEAVMSKVKGIRDQKKRSRGLVFSIIGGVALVLAFLLSYILHQFGYPTDLTLYGLTTVGIGFLFAGMVLYMG